MAYQSALVDEMSTGGFVPVEDITRTKVLDETVAGHKRSNSTASRVSCFAMAATMSLAPFLSPSSALADPSCFNENIATVYQSPEYSRFLGDDVQSSIPSVSRLIVQDMVSLIRNHIALPFSDSVAKRVGELHTLCLEEGDGQEELSVISIGGFVELLQSANIAIPPDLVVSFSGNLCVEWYKSARNKLSVEFLPNGQARYVVFSPDPKFKSRTDKATGVVSIKSLFRTLTPFSITTSILA